ncbi:MAG TPA: FAD:protein FMN transferase [Stellaceae bacterium]|nr:FAD:protein FMN transferase [Stellaceae bacterium]
MLGTFVEIAVAGAAPAEMNAAIDDAFAVIAEVHRLMSFHDPASDVSRLNSCAAADTVAVHPWTHQVLELALDLHRGSAGAFDIAVAPALQALGLLPSAASGGAPPSTAVADGAAIELRPVCQVRIHHPGLTLDLGGIAKGFAVDRAVDALRRRGMTQALVNAGGDMAAFGQDEPVTVHIRDPRDPLATIYLSMIANEALATSGGRIDPLRASGAAASAVIEPRRRQPVFAIAGATVRASTCVVADALTKIVMIMGEGSAALLAQYGASAMLITADGRVQATGDWREAVHLAA